MKTPAQMYALRAILAIFETGHYSAVVYLCGAWYQKGELARRLAIINITTAIGPMFSGYLQAAAYTGLNGVHGKAGWQWLFIIDGQLSHHQYRVGFLTVHRHHLSWRHYPSVLLLS